MMRLLLAGEIGFLAGFLFALIWVGATRRGQTKRTALVVDYVIVEVDSAGYEVSRRPLVSASELARN